MQDKLALSLLNENLRVMGVILFFVCLSRFCLWPHRVACGILLPRLGIEPVSPALEGGFLTIGPPGESLDSSFEICFCALGPRKV